MRCCFPALRFWQIIIALFVAAVAKVSAQAPASESVQQRITQPALRQPATDLQASSQNLGEIKIVQEYPKPEMFTFTAVQEFYYTDNVFYTHVNPLGSSGYIGSYTASFVPYSLRDWTPRISAQYNMFRYDTVPAGDFDNEQLAVSSNYVFGDNRDWSWGCGAILSRYTAPHQNDRQFFDEVIYGNQVKYVRQLVSDIPLYLIAACDVAYHQANPAAFNYLSNGLIFTAAYYPISELSVAPYFNPSCRNFPTDASFQNDRNDFHLAAGLDISWKPFQYVALDANIYHVNDYSNNSGLGFSYTTPGILLTGEIKF